MSEKDPSEFKGMSSDYFDQQAVNCHIEEAGIREFWEFLLENWHFSSNILTNRGHLLRL